MARSQTPCDQFTIPMRGNESGEAALYLTAHLLAFTIPMRGNEV